MPTENRSSNTEMVSAPFQREDRYIVVKRSDLAKVPVAYRSALVDPLFHLQAHLPQRECLVIESDWPEYEPTWAAIKARVTGQPAPQPHPEPIAWMVGTAIWRTKEEAERDAAETGMPMIPVGPMTGAGDIGLAREMLRRALRREDKWAFLCSGRNKQIAELRAKLAELPEMLISAIEREQERCSQEDYLMDSDDCIKVIRGALAASGVPVPQDQPYQGIPGTSFQRLNALANQGE